MEQTEEKVDTAKKYNVKLFPIYKMFSWDLLFYYSISFLFLTQNKGLTASQVLLADSFYPLFKLIFQIPCVNIVEIMGRRKSLILGNFFVALSILCLIIGNGFISVIFANLLMAVGYSIKSIAESALLNECIASRENKNNIFSNIDGKGSAYWYYLDAITAVSCGFLYVFNNYLPIILCFIMCIIACALSFKFLPYEDKNNKTKLDEVGDFKTYFKNLRTAFKNISRSNRLKALLLFSGVFSALLMIRSTVASSLFTELGVKEEYFGIIFAILTAICGFSSKSANFFHKRFRNKLLTVFSLSFSISMIVIGIVAIITGGSNVGFIIIICAYAVQYIIKGPYYTMQKRYLNSFSTPSMVTKIYSACTLIESLFSTLIYWITSFLLNYIPTSIAILILGSVFTILFAIILNYMKDKVGLKPEEYKKSDIYFTEVH